MVISTVIAASPRRHSRSATPGPSSTFMRANITIGMTVFDQRCDRCGTYLFSPQEAVRFLYHPGDLSLKDDSGLLCEGCWAGLTDWLGQQGVENRCARGGETSSTPRRSTSSAPAKETGGSC